MTIELHSNDLHLKINSKGAEVQSVFRNEIEYIWQAEKSYWPRHAPVLFPIVGRLKNDSYYFNNEKFTLTQHGFARNLEFELAEQNTHSAKFKLAQNESTLLKFPFEFSLCISYTVEDSKIAVNYELKNTSSNEFIYFSIGAHPGFNVPLLPEENFEDYYLQFENSQYQITELNEGLRTDRKKELHFNDNKLPLTHNLFDNDALVFEGGQIDTIQVRSSKSGHGIKLNCKDWPYFGIWSKKGSTPFVCLEPWYGIADRVSGTQLLNEKDGIIMLSAGNIFECQFDMEFF